ncbi:MAG: hypothetical protein EOP84_20280, partial [Verrucomicrobiaceae bacterium]
MSSLRVLVGVWCMVAAFLGNAPSLEAADPPAAELFTDTPLLQPTSTFEFRFSRPMVSSEEVGLSPKEPPITITPAIPGTFTWLSRSSGVFTPTEPPQVGAEYLVTLKPGLKAADGKPLSGNGRWTLRTPPFQQTSSSTFDEENLPPDAEVKLAFNLPVDLQSAVKLFEFVDDQGRSVGAKVEYGKRHNRLWLRPEEENWEQRWQKAKGVKPEPAAEADSDEDEAADGTEGEAAAKQPPLPAQLLVSPAEPLQTGVSWRLEMKAGLKDQSGKHRIQTPSSLPLGIVKPFRVTKVETSTYINSGRSVSVQFSSELAQDINEETAAKYFRLEPAVTNLRFEGGYSSFDIRGDFVRGQEYRLTLDPAVVSHEGLSPESGREYTFTFPPVAPRLYLPEITGHQIRSGRRQLEVLSANLKALRITARLISPEET